MAGKQAGPNLARSAVTASATEPVGWSPAERVASVIATLTGGRAPGVVLSGLPTAVTGVEIRADLVGDLDAGRLRQHFAGELIYVLRSPRHGGNAGDPTASRRARLSAAAARYDLVDLEAPHDLVPELLARIPPARRRISWHGDPTDLAGLRKRFDQMALVPARHYLLAPRADSCEQALCPLQLLKLLGRDDVTAFGTGSAGLFSRVLAPWLGAPMVFGQLSSPGVADCPALAGVPTVDELLNDYSFPALVPLRELFGIVARTTNTALFLRRLNTAFRELGRPSLFLSFAVADQPSFDSGFWPRVAMTGLGELGIPMRGLTMAAPYKDVALARADTASPVAHAAGGANLLLRQQTGWHATTTDGEAAVAALRAAGVPVEGRAVALIGCGGAGRAAAAALAAAGANVTLVNRSRARGLAAAELLKLPFVGLDEFNPTRYAVVVHATPARDDAPFAVDRLAEHAVVLDFVCAAAPTALVTAARQRRLPTIDGHEVLAQEVIAQLRLMTGNRLPND